MIKHIYYCTECDKEVNFKFVYFISAARRFYHSGGERNILVGSSTAIPADVGTHCGPIVVRLKELNDA